MSEPKEIHRDLLITPQEHEYLGGTPFEPDSPEDWFLTPGIKLGYSRDELQEARKRLGFEGSILLNVVFPGNPKQLGFKLGDIDESGRTFTDPVIAERDPETLEITEREDLKDEFYARLKEKGVELHLHPNPQAPEGQTSGGERQG